MAHRSPPVATNFSPAAGTACADLPHSAPAARGRICTPQTPSMQPAFFTRVGSVYRTNPPHQPGLQAQGEAGLYRGKDDPSLINVLFQRSLPRRSFSLCIQSALPSRPRTRFGLLGLYRGKDQLAPCHHACLPSNSIQPDGVSSPTVVGHSPYPKSVNSEVVRTLGRSTRRFTFPWHMFVPF